MVSLNVRLMLHRAFQREKQILKGKKIKALQNYLCHSSSLSARCFQTQAARHRSVAFKCDKTQTATSGGKLLRSGKDSS